ncbi:MAG: DUF445 domain-containing protein [Chitinophagales bacterium]
MLEWIQINAFYLIIPLVSGLVGWGTNVLALRMTFYPTEFWGLPPFFGWQGIIPAKAGVMAEKAVDLITSKLLDIKEVFARINPKKVAAIIEPEMMRLTQTITNEAMRAQAPLMWKAVPNGVKQRIFDNIAKELAPIVENMMQEIKSHITELFDVKTMVVAALTRDKNLLNDIFRKVGDQEFKFIARSGFFFGFFFGLIQMTICFFYNPWWMLPLAGLLVGYATNWLALKLIFEPVEPKQVFGYKVQGLFMKRQASVAKEYAEIITAEILTVPNMFDAILHGEASEQLTQIIKKYVEQAVDITADYAGNSFKIIVGTKKYNIIKNIATWSLIQEIPMLIAYLYPYTEEALDLKNTLTTKMTNLPAVEFQGFLRPVFQEDEFKLIIVGALLGCLAGVTQLYFLFP